MSHSDYSLQATRPLTSRMCKDVGFICHQVHWLYFTSRGQLFPAFCTIMTRNRFLAPQNALKTSVLDGGVQTRNQKVKEHLGEWVAGLTLQGVTVHPPGHRGLRGPADGAFDEHV